RGIELERLHRELLPLDEADFDAEGVGAWIRPYESETVPGEEMFLEVEVRNPAASREEVAVTMSWPPNWARRAATATVTLDPGEHGWLKFDIVVPDVPAVHRAVITADLRVGDRRYGQLAEALVTIR